MPNQSDSGDDEWARSVDNSIILMSLLLAKTQLEKAKYPVKIKTKLAKHLDALIERYKDPTV